MRALVFAPGFPSAEVDILEDLETLQRLVGGQVETATGFDLPAGVIAYVNEGENALELQRNRGYRGTIVIVGFGANRGYRGTIVVVGFDADGAQIGLTDDQAAEIIYAVG